MRRHDVALYTPLAAGLYDRARRAPGGAELQTTFIARALAREGMRVAHIVFPLRDPVIPPEITVLERAEDAGGRRTIDKATEVRRTWQALVAADADVYLVRGASPAVGVIALFCLVHRRKLLFSSANNYDFTFDTRFGRGLDFESYRLGLRGADAVVVQTEEQLELARRAFPRLRSVTAIPSFAEPAEPADSEPRAFLWMGRIVDYKQPLRYLELAEAVPEASFWMIATETNETPADLAGEVRARALALTNVEMLEPRSHEAAMDLVAQTVANVSTSRLEGMPNVFLEAWASGVPTLTLEFDPDGRIASRGLGVAADGSWERFVSGARELWSERRDRERLSRHVQSYVREVHSPPVVGGLWAGVCRRLASS
ncbi:MAG: glycosyltransferase family 4 protein [Thermoleophilaceae bacterium]